jgi:hypothetical protein
MSPAMPGMRIPLAGKLKTQSLPDPGPRSSGGLFLANAVKSPRLYGMIEQIVNRRRNAKKSPGREARA